MLNTRREFSTNQQSIRTMGPYSAGSPMPAFRRSHSSVSAPPTIPAPVVKPGVASSCSPGSVSSSADPSSSGSFDPSSSSLSPPSPISESSLPSPPSESPLPSSSSQQVSSLVSFWGDSSSAGTTRSHGSRRADCRAFEVNTYLRSNGRIPLCYPAGTILSCV